MFDQIGGGTGNGSLGRASASAKVGGYLLIVFGVLGLLLGLAKLATDYSPFYPDLLFAMVDTVTGVMAMAAGWLAIKARSAAGILAPLLLAVAAGILALSGFVAYGWESATGIFGILFLLFAIPLALTYRS